VRAPEHLLDELNPQQRDAVAHGAGPLLVLAGAGSGKTRVLTYRIAYLLATSEAQASEITAVTFTNKAAREMRERVASLLGQELVGGFVGTFHRWALETLRRYPAAAGLPPRFAILDADDQRALISHALKDEGLQPAQYPPRLVLARISSALNGGKDPERLEADSFDPAEMALARIWRRYQRLKTEARAIDFDDMLVLALKALDKDERAATSLRQRAHYLLVDEFQDTNRLQLALLLNALGGDRNITAVGDEDQSIYRWRGAEMDNILSFEKHFPAPRIVALEENYRSTAPILEAAGSLIANNRKRRGKTLFTRRDGGEPVRVFIASDERDEAHWVAERIEEMSLSTPLGAIAVLMRTNAQSRPFEEELTRRRVPHRVVGGLRFWQRAEVKDALAYLRLVFRPDDVVAFERVINVPARGIGAATLDLLRRHAEATALPLPEAARQLPEGLMARARIALESFFGLVDEGRSRSNDLDPGDLVGWLLEESGLLAQYDGADPEAVIRRENLAQFAGAVAEAAGQDQSIDEFLDAVALLEESDDATVEGAVSLMTLHAAKGLEFDVVFLAGLEEGLLPHTNSRSDADGLEEERRLAYVGMTRARRWLALTGAHNRFLFGQRKQTQISPFMLELPLSRLLDVSDASLLEPVRPGEVIGGPPPSTPFRRSSAHPPDAPRREAARSPRRPIAATVTDGEGVGWRPGNRVRHRRFGTGVVLSCQGRGPQLKLIVYFDRAGRKTLIPSLAKLERL
jgi:DNA helicase-2/ATP-dependent DNA helicase PcrA